MKEKAAKKVKTTAAAPARTNSIIDLASVKDLTEFMKEQGLVEFNFKQGNLELHLRREGSHPVGSFPMHMPTPVTNGAHHPAPAATPAKAAAPEKSKNTHVVKSPFVGTFYRSAGPNQEAFVEEGKIVDAGDTLCIVEAMKLMNEIESDIKGRVSRVLVKNETPVEFGEALFELEVM